MIHKDFFHKFSPSYKYKKISPLQVKNGKRLLSVVMCATLFTTFFSGCSKKDITELLPQEEDPEVIAEFDTFLHDFFITEVNSNTINLHYTLSNPESFGITNHTVSLGDLSEDAMADDLARYENYVSALDDFSYQKLSTDQQLTYDILYDFLSTQLDTADFYYYDELLRPTSGVQSELPILFEEYAFYSKDDVEDYLELLSIFDDYFQQVIAFEEQKAAAGLFMSDSACENIIAQCQDFTANADNHYLIETFNTRLDKLSSLEEAEKEAYKAQNETLVKENVLPAYDMLAEAMTNLLGSGSNDLGLCYFPDGKEYYERLVYYNTGCSDSIADIEDMIAKERAATLQEAADLMEEDPELWDICAEVTVPVTDPVATLNRLQEAMAEDFPAAPDTGFTVSYIEECMADYLAPAFYITAPIDDYSSNSIYINPETDTSDISYFTTLAHEGYPGHLYQTVYSYESGICPARNLLNYPGYIEGWATYVEMLSYSYAGLDEDVATLLQKNQASILSLYATTDLGIHYEGWDFDDTLTFWNNFGIGNETVVQEIYDLIVQEPAHYLKYYVGYIQFEELKEYAMAKYLVRYDDISFHKALLEIGPAPFDIIKEYLDEYYEGATQ